MAIVINGSGTVTGLAVGGLPDGTVDAGTLATDSVVTGKIADGTIANADIADLAASKLTGALPAISGANLTSLPVQGIDADADSWQYRLNVLDQNSGAVIDFPTADKLGSNVTESAGRFTVATAGWYLIACKLANQSAFADNTNAWLRKNGTRMQGSIYWEGNTEINYLANTMIVICEASANDIFDMYGNGYWSGNTDNTGSSWFTGVRLGA